MNQLILIRGGGDLASGVALRLYRSGMKVVIAELSQPLAVRREVSFAEAVYSGQIQVEDVIGRLVKQEQVQATIESGEIPVLIDPEANILTHRPFAVVVDGRMTKLISEPLPVPIPLHIGLGPGFYAGRNCHAVIETRRSHTLGRVYWDGTTQPDSGQPEGDRRRVLRAPASGMFLGQVEIGKHVETGQLVATIDDRFEIISPFEGVVRGILRSGLEISKGLKVGDIDPRDDPQACFLVSDKALAVGGGVLEAILSREELRDRLW